MVTVVDPRHPLFGRTFPLLNITNMPHAGRCCIVRYLGTLERAIPLQVTDRSPEPVEISPSPLIFASVRQLLEKNKQFMSQLVEDKEDGNSDQDIVRTCSGKSFRSIEGTDADGARADLDSADSGTTAKSISTVGEHLLSSSAGEQHSAGGK
jgi:hypothetical protein